MKPTLVALCLVAMHVLAGPVDARFPRPPSPPSSAGSPTIPEVTTELKRFDFARVLMGVRMNIILYAPDEETAKTAGVEAFNRIAEIEQVASTYRKTSELKQLEKRALKGPTPISKDLFNLLSMSQRLYEQTGGVFDCTIGHLVECWREADKAVIPPNEPFVRVLRKIGESKDLILDPEKQTAELKASIGFSLDAIAKGYAGDEALKVLRAHGVACALIDLSGDVVLGDPPPGSEYWNIAIEFGDPHVQSIILRLANAGVATSGDTEQHFVVEGVRYSHIIDPRTGMACTNRSAACVIAPTGAMADALATACCVLGSKDAPAMIERFENVSARIRTPSDDDQAPQDITTPGFSDIIQPAPPPATDAYHSPR